MNMRRTSVAGSFYPNSCEEIKRYINHFDSIIRDIDVHNNMDVKAMISPHAGYVYSGFTANFAFNFLSKELKKNIKRVIVIGPSHKVYLKGASVALYDEYETPCGNLEIDLNFSTTLMNSYDFLIFDDKAHHEHSTETQMPFIKHYFKDVQVVEIVYGDVDFNQILTLIDELLEDDDNFIVISTDLSHFYTLEEARKKDNICLNAIENFDITKFDAGGEACGMIGVKAILSSCLKKNFRSKIVDYRTSFDASGDSNSVVGYVSALIGK